MPSRRPHTNSHHGCRRCKQKKVKCDEGHPSCQRCISKGEVCEYNALVQRHYTVSTAPATTSRKGKKPAATRGTFTSGDPPAQQWEEVHPGSEFALSYLHPLARNSLELKLLEYFQAKMPFPACGGASPSQLWRQQSDTNHFGRAIYRNLAEHRFLLDGVLSFCSIHMAALTNTTPLSPEMLWSQSLSFQNQALEAFKPHLGRINGDNAEAAIAFSALVTLCALAMPVLESQIGQSSSSAGVDTLSHIQKIVRLFRGCRAITEIGRHGGMPKKHNLHEWWRKRLADSPEVDHPESAAAIEGLEAIVPMLVEDAALQEEYIRILGTLKQVFRRMRAQPTVPYHMFVWAANLSNELVAELDQHRPLALVVLAHWAVMLNHLPNFWGKTWSLWVVTAVVDAVGSEWHGYLAWPTQMLGIDIHLDEANRTVATAPLIEMAHMGKPGPWMLDTEASSLCSEDPCPPWLPSQANLLEMALPQEAGPLSDQHGIYSFDGFEQVVPCATSSVFDPSLDTESLGPY